MDANSLAMYLFGMLFEHERHAASDRYAGRKVACVLIPLVTCVAQMHAAEARAAQLEQELEAQTLELMSACDTVARLTSQLQEQELSPSPSLPLTAGSCKEELGPSAGPSEECHDLKEKVFADANGDSGPHHRQVRPSM